MVQFEVYFVLSFMLHLTRGGMELFWTKMCRKGKYDLIYEDISYVQCVEKCRSKTACNGVSVNSMANICRLHIFDEVWIGPERCAGYVYTLKANWKQKTSKYCEGIVCRYTETCVNNTNSNACRQQECDPVYDIQNGRVYGSGSLKVNSKVLYRCDIQENDINIDVIRTCQSNGLWSGRIPVCPLPECQMLSDIENGEVHGTDQRTVGSEVTYVCKDKYKVKRGNEKRTCQADLNWSGTQPTCLQYVFVVPVHQGIPYFGYFDLFANGISFVNRNVILFHVKAHKNAHLLLQLDRNSFDTNTKEVVLGGHGNTVCLIRHGLTIIFDNHYEDDIIDGSAFRGFWIKSTSSCIAVGKGDTSDKYTFLEYCGMSQKYKYLSIGTGYSGQPTFRFP